MGYFRDTSRNPSRACAATPDGGNPSNNSRVSNNPPTFKPQPPTQPAQVCPGTWQEANLEEVQLFLRSEAKSGTWKPLEGLPL